MAQLTTCFFRWHGHYIPRNPTTFSNNPQHSKKRYHSFEKHSNKIEWTVQFSLALGWLVFGLSVSAILILMWLIRRGAASQVASLFYLVPPVTALEAFILFNERLGPLAIAGGVVAVAGVALVVTGGPRPLNR